jgi:hypothetical protein
MRVVLSGEYERFVRATALTYQMIYRGPVRGLFKELKPPVLLLAGEHDRTIPMSAYAPPGIRAQIPTLAAAAREVVKEIPHGKLARRIPQSRSCSAPGSSRGISEHCAEFPQDLSYANQRLDRVHARTNRLSTADQGDYCDGKSQRGCQEKHNDSYSGSNSGKVRGECHCG